MKPNNTLCPHMSLPARRGMTLAEIITSLAVFTMVGIASVNLVIFMAKSQNVTTMRLESSGKAQFLTSQLAQDARTCNLYIMYSEFDDYSESLLLQKASHNTFLQPSLHMSAGESGNYLIMVWQHPDSNEGDSIPAPIKKIVGIYTDVKALEARPAPTYLPVRIFTKEFSAADGVVGAGTVIEELLPKRSEIASHNVLGYANSTSAADTKLFRISEDNAKSVSLSLPLKLRENVESANFRVETTFEFSNL